MSFAKKKKWLFWWLENNVGSLLLLADTLVVCADTNHHPEIQIVYPPTSHRPRVSNTCHDRMRSIPNKWIFLLVTLIPTMQTLSS